MSADDDAFHPMGTEWEEEMEAMLDDTEYDTELGMDIAEDAQRLVAGEMSEEEFHDEYHDAIVAEFGVDDRPNAEEFEDKGLIDSLKKLDGDGDVDRREVMKKMGAGAAFLGLGGLATKENAESSAYGHVHEGAEDRDTQWGMVIDLERCDGCLSCVTGCIEENNTSTGANWMYVLTYEDEKTDQENFLVRPCQHCTNAPCEKVCPVRARHTRSEDGIVLTDYETCIGCRYCQVACPYGVNYFQWGQPDVPDSEMMKTATGLDELRSMGEEERVSHLNEEGDHTVDSRGRWVDSRPPKGVMGKCTFCPSRQDGVQGEDMVGTTACMDACDETGSNAIHFGDLKDPDSRPNRLLRERAELAGSREVATSDNPQEDRITGSATADGELSAFKLLEDVGTQPNVTYLGNQPGPEAEQVEGPVQYENLRADGRDVTDRRKEHTDLGAAANQRE